MTSTRARDVHISQELHANSTLVLESTGSPFEYRVVLGGNLVLVLDIEETVEGTSICLCRELVLEISGSPPPGETLTSEEWLVQAMYRHGDRSLQFESATASERRRF